MKQAILIILLSLTSSDYSSLREFCDDYSGNLRDWGVFAATYNIGVPFVYTSHRTTITTVTEFWDSISRKYELVSRTEKTKVVTKYTEHDFRYAPLRTPPDPNAADILPPPIINTDPNALREIILNDPNRYGPLELWEGLLK